MDSLENKSLLLFPELKFPVENSGSPLEAIVSTKLSCGESIDWLLAEKKHCLIVCVCACVCVCVVYV